MKARVITQARKSTSDCLLVLACFQDESRKYSRNSLQAALGKDVDAAAVAEGLGSAVAAEAFEGRAGQILRHHGPDGDRTISVLLCGLGARDSVTPETLRRVFGLASRGLPGSLRKLKSARWVIDVGRGYWRQRVARARSPKLTFEAGQVPPTAPCDLAELVGAGVEGWALGSYQFLDHQTEKKPRPLPDLEIFFAPQLEEGVGRLKNRLEKAEVLVDSVRLARDLSNTPANALRPDDLAKRARSEARKWGLNCQILDLKALEKEKMGALIGVGQASSSPPCLIVQKYEPPGPAGKRPPLVLVGKAVTFDSGGLSIKPAVGMVDMKMDMSGGAAVLAALSAVGRLKPARPVIGLIPTAENMIDGNATRPGDVLHTRSGLTIEVVNTDAEGRLILADALDYSRKFKPELVIDVATLTGACLVALGDRVSGLFSNQPAAADRVRQAAADSGERVWELPMYREYFDQIRSPVADMKNSGGRYAGSITAAALLARFIEGVPWCHLDVAGTAWSDRTEGYSPRGATGAGVRLLVELALD